MTPKSYQNGVGIFNVMGFWEGPDADCHPVALQMILSWVGMRSEVLHYRQGGYTHIEGGGRGRSRFAHDSHVHNDLQCFV